MTEKMLENLKRMYEDLAISELEFYKLKSKLFENPKEFFTRYQKIDEEPQHDSHHHR